jgi:hypothetical protein
MRQRAPRRAADRQPQAPVAADPDALAHLQRAVGNRGMTRLLQRVGVADIASVDWSKLSDVLSQLTVWDMFVEANRSQAKIVAIPSEWRDLAGEYAGEFPDDGRWIRAGILRKPRWWSGGFLIDEAGYETHAITLDRDVFFNPARRDEPSVDTYVHELVHVGQYGDLGVAGFLGSYLGEYLKHYLEGVVSGDDTKAYHDILHEKHARGIELRFQAWRLKKEEETTKRAEEKERLEKPYKEAEAEGARRRPGPATTPRRISISGSVGAHADNRPEDVRRVAERLEQLGFLSSGTADLPSVTRAIRTYQESVLAWRSPDGRVDPGGETLRALSEGEKSVGLRLRERR